MTQKPQLTEDQQQASDAFFDFLMSDAEIFVLSGGAGVGKTFLMSHICETVMDEYTKSCKLMGVPEEYDNLAFTATTNKAAEVLEQSLGLPTQTIHSYLGLKVKNNWRTGKTTLEKTQNWKVRSRVILFIDESSMIDASLLSVIKESFENSKIVFVGDHAQMAPIAEKSSPIYDEVDKDNFVFLGKPVRNADSPPLVELCKQLRDTVETGVFHSIKQVDDYVEYLSPQDMQKKLTEVFSDPEPSSRILCFTNDQTKNYNEFIREIRGLPLEITAGDKLVVAQTYEIGKSSLSVEREVHVVEVHDIITDHGYGELFADKTPIRSRIVTIDVLSGNTQGRVDVRVALEKERLDLAIKHFGREKDWHTYFELKGLCADLRDQAACTVYKSQGSTYDSVFIDIGNIGTSYDAEQVARMLFVAASRARHKVYLYGALPQRYVGKEAA